MTPEFVLLTSGILYLRHFEILADLNCECTTKRFLKRISKVFPS